MRCLAKFACAALLSIAAVSAWAAEVAVLRNGFEIRHERREQIGESTRLFLGAATDAGYVDVPSSEISTFRHDDTPLMPPAAQSAMPTASPINDAAVKISPEQLKHMIEAASDRHQVDADLVASVIRAESNFNPRALSPKGAQGLMQLMPGTAAQLGVANAFQPDANIDAGTSYLRELLVQYNGDIVRALAAYNAGPHRVQQYGGVPPFRETHAYVARIVRDFNRKKIAAGASKPATSTAFGRQKKKRDLRSQSSRSTTTSASVSVANR